jgi:LPXTG-site transpeptidase (sortase) family protein
MNYFRFAIMWALMFAALFVVFSAFGLAPVNVVKMNRTILAFFAPAESAAGEITQSSSAPRGGANLSLETGNALVVTEAGILPDRIVIDKIGVSSAITHPQTADTRVLDKELQKGVVQYPGSGYLNENRNLFFFGHSTGLANVRNAAYKAFNDLGKLNIGDTLLLYAGNEVYEYAVISASLTKATEALVNFSTGRRMITLSTCNTFGKKEDRFVVTAEFAKQYVLAQNI